jgi:glucose/arabinose dehydrogenase
VKYFHLRDLEQNPTDEPMIRMEKAHRLHGAVSMQERADRLGQYYTLRWHEADGAGQDDALVVFEYQQGATASQVKRMIKSFPSAATDGIAEFAVIGNDYRSGGKILAWKATLQRGNRVIAAQQSYLWK